MDYLYYLGHWESIVLNFKELSVEVLKVLKTYFLNQSYYEIWSLI